MADGLGTELNLALGHETNLVALQRLDPDIVRIVDHASHTASYQFLAKENKWSPRGCEGPLFLAERSTAPQFRLVILNQVNPTNFAVDVIPSLEAKLLGALIVLRDPEKKIKLQGVWFNNPAERDRLFEALADLQRRLGGARGDASSLETAEPAGDGAEPTAKPPKSAEPVAAPASTTAPVPAVATVRAETAVSVEEVLAASVRSGAGGRGAASSRTTGEEEGRPSTGSQGPVVSRDVLRATLLDLAEDDAFLDLLTARVRGRLARG